MKNIIPTDECIFGLTDSYLSGTLSEDEFNECVKELHDAFPDKSDEEIRAMCYNLLC